MAIPSGLSAQLGIGKETTWGTAVTVDTFLPFTSESIQNQFNYIETKGLQAGIAAQQSGLHSQTTQQISGGFNLDVTTKSFGKLLNMLHGNTVTPTQVSSSAAYMQTHNIGTTTPSGKGLTVQVGRPDVSGTVRPFTYAGCKVASVTFSCDQGGVLTSSWNVVGKSETTGTALASASYSYGTTFKFQEGSIEFDDSVLADCVRSASVTITLPLASDRFCIGGGTTIKEPVVNDLIQVEATLEMEFSSLTQYTAYTGATRRKLELNFTGSTAIESSYYPEFFITIPATVTKGETPSVGGPDLLTQTVTLQGVYDGSNPLAKIEYQSTDTSL